MNGLSTRDGARMIALAAAYAVTAIVGLRLGATVHDSPPLWPAAGVAVAALCLGGIRLWPGVALGTLVAIVWRGNGSLLTAAIVVSTTLEAIVASFLLTRVARFRPSLRRTRDAAALIIAGGIVAPAIGAAVGAGAFAVAGRIHAGFAHEWLEWFLGDAIGVIVFAPAVLVWTGTRESHRLGFRIAMTSIAALTLVSSAVALSNVSLADGTAAEVGILMQAYAAVAATTVLLVAASAAERRDALARLTESERQLSLVFDTNSDTLLLFAVDGADRYRLVTANRALCASLRRYRPNVAHVALAGISIESFITDVLGLGDDSVPKTRAVFRQTIETRAPVSYENNDWGAPDEMYEVTLVPVFDQDGRCTHVLRSSRDISARKEAERSLRRAEVTRRTLEAELFHAQKMEAIGTLAGGIAHDFNNILAAIVGNAEMAQIELPAVHAARHDIGEVLRAARRARELVQQILTFSRKQQPVRRPVRIAEVVDDVIRLLRATIPSTIKIATDISDPTLHVYGEPTQLHQVLMNLCTNAAHAIGNQHGTIDLRQSFVEVGGETLHGDLVPGRYVCLTVRDTGPGMDRATLERVFEPFFTTKTAGVGTGLGLAVVHGIVKSHDGTVLVESAPGRGTTFQLYFPVLASDVAIAGAVTMDVPRGDGERVLFVDDEPSLTSVAQRMLERLGYRVVALASSTEALAAFREDPSAFDVVISDLTMPGLTGSQLAAELRRLRASLPVILATGYLDRLDPDTARALDARELLLKPYTTEDLAAAVHRALNHAA